MQFPEAAGAVIDQALQFIYSFGPLAEKTVILGMYGSVSERFAPNESCYVLRKIISMLSLRNVLLLQYRMF